jgi:Fe-S-cluster-containing hydrogenase component 2
MPHRLAIVPERCSGCRTCEIVCSLARFGVNNPKKSCIRVMTLYPHPVIRMPVVCRQCGEPKCADGCPTNAISRTTEGNRGTGTHSEDGTGASPRIVTIDPELCVSCLKCVDNCPFGAMFAHEDIENPFNCNLCHGTPQCVAACPKKAILYVPTRTLGQAHRLANVLNYAHMKEVEYVEEGEKKHLRYAEVERSTDED